MAHPRASKQAVAERCCLVSRSLGQHRNCGIFLLSCTKEIRCSSFFICCYPPPTSADQTNWGRLQGSWWWREAKRCVGVRPLLQGMEEQMILPAVLIKKIDFFHLFPEQRPVLSLADYSITSHKNIKLLYRNQIKIVFHDVNKGTQVDFVSLSLFFSNLISHRREKWNLYLNGCGTLCI